MWRCPPVSPSDKCSTGASPTLTLVGDLRGICGQASNVWRNYSAGSQRRLCRSLPVGRTVRSDGPRQRGKPDGTDDPQVGGLPGPHRDHLLSMRRAPTSARPLRCVKSRTPDQDQRWVGVLMFHQHLLRSAAPYSPGSAGARSFQDRCARSSEDRRRARPETGDAVEIRPRDGHPASRLTSAALSSTLRA